MADKDTIADWVETPAVDNDNIGGISLQENVMRPPAVNDAFREMMSQVKAWFKTSQFRLRDSTDETKLAAFDFSQIPTGTTRTFTFPGAGGTLLLTTTPVLGQLTGLTIGTNVSDPTNDINIAAGSIADSTNVDTLVLGTAFVKRLDAAWAVGTGQGGRDTGATADGVWYVYVIKRVDTGVVDVIFSLSKTGPTMPANYTLFRRLPGAFIRSTGVNRAFMQVGKNMFLFKTPTSDAVDIAIGPSRTLIALSAPKDMLAIFRASLYRVAGTASVVLQPTYETDVVLAFLSTPGASLATEVANAGVAGEFTILVNSSSQIAARANIAGTMLSVINKGFIDPEF